MTRRTGESRVMACHNAPLYHDSSHLANLDKANHYVTKEKEIWSQSYDKQQQHNCHPVKGWENCYDSDYGISYRTSRVWTLLVNHLKYATYNMSWVWEYDHTKTTSDTFQRRGIMGDGYVPCRYCGNPIVFDDNVRSKTGRKIPLNEWDHKYHDCRLSPYNKASATAVEKREIRKINEYQAIEDLRNQIAETNNKLWNYELELVVRHKED